MNPFVKFMASKTGRITRIVTGAALIVWGLLGLTGTTGIIVAVIGLVPLLAGLLMFACSPHSSKILSKDQRSAKNSGRYTHSAQIRFNYRH